MEKSLFWLGKIRKGATIIASLLLFVGFALDVIFRYLGISAMIGFYVADSGVLLFGVIFALSVAICLMLDRKKEGKKEIKDENEKQTFMVKLFKFFEKNGNTIKIFLYSLAFFFVIYFSYNILASGHYWTIYYNFCMFFWALFILCLVEIFSSKDRKTLITNAVFLTIQLGLMIWATIYAHSLFFDVTSKVSLKMLDFIYLAIIFIFVILTLIVVSDNQISKVKRTRNFGLGIITLCGGVVMYFVQKIAEFMLNKWDTSADLSLRVQYLMTAYNICTYIVLGIILIAMLNVAVNTVHYIRTKNWLGLVDVLASFIAVVLCVVGINYFANFVAFLK